jgi:shikimate 5-dehydrogenase
MGDEIMGVGLDNYETMNADDSIKIETKLFGLIAEEAMKNRLFVLLNKMIKPEAMMIPMNIRPDDFYFTVVNMKKSHVNGAYIAKEYQEEVLELLDEKDEIVEVYGKCDFVLREGEKLKGFLIEKNDVNSLEQLAADISKIMKEN